MNALNVILSPVSSATRIEFSSHGIRGSIQPKTGPFNHWMFRDPGNIILKVGPHSVAHMLDLVGVSDIVFASAAYPLVLPAERHFIVTGTLRPVVPERACCWIFPFLRDSVSIQSMFAEAWLVRLPTSSEILMFCTSTQNLGSISTRITPRSPRPGPSDLRLDQRSAM